MAKAATIATGEWRENCYILHGEGSRALVIDPGEGLDQILAYLEAEALTVEAIANTHAHYDHIGSVSDLQKRYGARFYLHAADQPLLRQANFYRALFGGKRTIGVPTVDADLAGCERLELCGLGVQVLHTPGHTPGSVSFLIDGALFSGDTVFRNQIGRTDLPGGDKTALAQSVQQLLRLPPETAVHPGHGSPTTVQQIIESNAAAMELLK